MALVNPNLATEILYGNSGDVRNEINSYQQVTTAGHYADENEIPGILIIAGMRRATRIINAFLEPVYADQVPFATVAAVPLILDEISSDMATYFTLRSSAAALGKVSDQKKLDYYDSYVDPQKGMLSLISQRKIQIPELTSVSPFEGKQIRAEGRYPVFDISDETGAGPDPKLIDDIGSERS